MRTNGCYFGRGTIGTVHKHAAFQLKHFKWFTTTWACDNHLWRLQRKRVPSRVPPLICRVRFFLALRFWYYVLPTGVLHNLNTEHLHVMAFTQNNSLFQTRDGYKKTDDDHCIRPQVHLELPVKTALDSPLAFVVAMAAHIPIEVVVALAFCALATGACVYGDVLAQRFIAYLHLERAVTTEVLVDVKGRHSREALIDSFSPQSASLPGTLLAVCVGV